MQNSEQFLDQGQLPDLPPAVDRNYHPLVRFGRSVGVVVFAVSSLAAGCAESSTPTSTPEGVKPPGPPAAEYYRSSGREALLNARVRARIDRFVTAAEDGVLGEPRVDRPTELTSSTRWAWERDPAKKDEPFFSFRARGLAKDNGVISPDPERLEEIELQYGNGTIKLTFAERSQGTIPGQRLRTPNIDIMLYDGEGGSESLHLTDEDVNMFGDGAAMKDVEKRALKLIDEMLVRVGGGTIQGEGELTPTPAPKEELDAAIAYKTSAERKERFGTPIAAVANDTLALASTGELGAPEVGQSAEDSSITTWRYKVQKLDTTYYIHYAGYAGADGKVATDRLASMYFAKSDATSMPATVSLEYELPNSRGEPPTRLSPPGMTVDVPNIWGGTRTWAVTDSIPHSVDVLKNADDQAVRIARGVLTEAAG